MVFRKETGKQAKHLRHTEEGRANNFSRSGLWKCSLVVRHLALRVVWVLGE